MSFKKFGSYMEDRKDGVESTQGLVGNPKVKLVADYDGPQPGKPTKGEGQGELASYKAANGNAAAKKPESGGFADLGDKNLKYSPNTDGGSSKLTALGTEVKGEWPKAKNESFARTNAFLKKTKKLSGHHFAAYMAQECSTPELDNLPMVNADKPGPFHPHPSEAVRYVAALGGRSEKIVEQLVIELKRANVLGEVLKAALEYPETYRELTELFEGEDGERRAKYFARALKETVGPPMGLKPGMDDDEEHPDMDMMGDEEDDMDDDAMDMDDDPDADQDGGDADIEDDDMDDTDDMDDMGDMGDEDDMGDEMDDEEMGDGDMDDMGPPPKFGKKPMKSAPSNLMGSMSKMGLG